MSAPGYQVSEDSGDKGAEEQYRLLYR
jgi:hypothetical protein